MMWFLQIAQLSTTISAIKKAVKPQISQTIQIRKENNNQAKSKARVRVLGQN